MTIPNPNPLPVEDGYRAWKILQDKSTWTWPPFPLLQPPYLVLPPTGVDQPVGPRIKNWLDLVQNTERETERSQMWASSHKYTHHKYRSWTSVLREYSIAIRQLLTVVGWSIHWELLGLIWAVGKTRKLWLKESLNSG